MQPLTPEQILALTNQVVGGGDNDLLCASLDGSVRFANPSACRTLGYSFADMLKKNVADYSPKHSHELWNGHFRRVFANGSDEINTYHKDCSGTSYPVVIYSLPHVVDDTREELILSLITNARTSPRYRRMLEAVEDSHRIGSFDYNLNDQSILASDNLLAIMGTHDPEELRPARITDRLTKEDTARWNSAMIDFMSGHHRMDEQFVMRTAGGVQSLVRVVVWSLLDEGKVTGIAGYYEVIDESGKDRMVSLKEAQRQHIVKALRYTNGRVTGPNGAARLLDINGKTLFARMKKLGIKRDDFARRG